MTSVTIGAPDPRALAGFHTPPAWPSVSGVQQIMAHLDIAVRDLDGAVTLAVDVGATLVDYQPQDDVRVMLDPAGHPFCLFLWDGCPDAPRCTEASSCARSARAGNSSTNVYAWADFWPSCRTCGPLSG